jgi:hypothetical protein
LKSFQLFSFLKETKDMLLNNNKEIFIVFRARQNDTENAVNKTIIKIKKKKTLSLG